MYARQQTLKSNGDVNVVRKDVDVNYGAITLACVHQQYFNFFFQRNWWQRQIKRNIFISILKVVFNTELLNQPDIGIVGYFGLRSDCVLVQCLQGLNWFPDSTSNICTLFLVFICIAFE